MVSDPVCTLPARSPAGVGGLGVASIVSATALGGRWVRSPGSAARSLARPQSMTTVSPSSPMSTLDGLRSRWMIRCRCAYATASTIAMRLGRSPSFSVSARTSAATWASERPATSFMA
jgi:hypothetical protein